MSAVTNSSPFTGSNTPSSTNFKEDFRKIALHLNTNADQIAKLKRLLDATKHVSLIAQHEVKLNAIDRKIAKNDSVIADYDKKIRDLRQKISRQTRVQFNKKYNA